MSVCETIKARRQMLGISQNDLAEISGIGIATVKNIESGNANPSLSTIEALAQTLGMELKIEVRKTY